MLLTFDYELPLGGIKKSFDHSLFSPTNELLRRASNLDVPIVLFADILSYIVFKKNNIKEYYEPFENQVQNALDQGHDVQLHLHPHWLESDVSGDTFKPSLKYKLADFVNSSEYSIEKIIKDGVDELTRLCKRSDPKYKCIAYRGGGYNLHPYTEKILRNLYAEGILFDSSISKGYYYAADSSLIDYRSVPNIPNWFIDNGGDFTKKGTNGIYEIPIASRAKGMFEVPTAVKLKFLNRNVPEFRGKMIHTSHKVSGKQKINQLFSSRMFTVDNYTYSISYLKKILDSYVKKHKKNDEISFCLIGHPKSMDTYSFELLEQIVNYAKIRYDGNVRFCRYSDVLHLPNKHKV